MPETHDPGEHHFHYNREDREALLSDETKRVLQKTKLFTMNRRNMIILADIAIILLFTMIFAPFFLGGKTHAKVDGFSTNLKAYVFDGNLLISMKVEAKEDNSLEAGLVKVVFTAEGSDEEVEVIDLLPGSVGEPRVLRAEIPAPNDKKVKVYALVEINEKTGKLSAKAKQE
ncbi:MAG: hypothetical protein JEZ04_00530 [Spirochaetales bacterium]|nr:hypothetical protein [Spirochaetales bacterium]